MRKIKRTICTEELVSRVPSLFAYCEFDDFNVLKVHKATDSIDGSYGKYACGIKAPYSLNVKFSDEDDTTTVAETGECISYRTLMNYYYKAKAEGLKSNQSLLMEFVERGIGLITIKVTPVIVENDGGKCTKWWFEYSNDHKFIFEVEPVKIEKTIYLSQTRKLYDEMVKLKKLCREYQRELTETPEERETFETKNVCCICDDYWERGGDTMVDILAFLISEANSIAEEYLEYACLDKTALNVGFTLTNTYNDGGYYTPYLLNWKPGQVIYSGEKFIHENSEGVMTMYQNDTANDYYGHYDEENERVVFDENDVTEVKVQSGTTPEISITQQADSKLKSLRRYTSYNDEYGEQQKPEENYDWLYFYTVGMVRNLRTKNDELGNIGFYGSDASIKDGEDYVVNLMAYGDIITDIETNTEERELTFTYYTGAHLKAKGTQETDDDGNTIYYYNDFVIDTESEYSKNCGIKYTEVYYYEEDSETEKLINGDIEDITFNEYITDENEIKRFTDGVFPFYTGNSNLSYNKRIDTKTTSISYLNTELEYTKTYDIDVFNADIFKEDYLMGIHFKPYVKDDVNIDRGKNAAFERHIKLGEVKTMQDMENYQNGGFFNIKEY